MIDHRVMIGGEDVSADVIKIDVQQSMDTDSDPGKFVITLANPAQKYTMKWLPHDHRDSNHYLQLGLQHRK